MIDDLVTALVTASPSARHPSTEIIEATVAGIRWHLPEAKIVIACDGIRAEQEHLRQNYVAFVLRLADLCRWQWTNVKLAVFAEFLHQAHVVASCMNYIKTPLVLFTEWDMELLPIEFPWEESESMIAAGHVNVIRFGLGDERREEWRQFMLGPIRFANAENLESLQIFVSQFQKTVQWSQRTHLASVGYYRKMLAEHVKPADRCYLEDRFYGQCDDWVTHRLSIYMPEGDIARVRHLDGRGAEPKHATVLEGK